MPLLPKEERTRHLIAVTPGPISQCLADGLGLAPSRTAELLQWGAVYLNKKRTTEDRPVTSGDYLRVHLQPRRFPAAERDWRAHVVRETPDYIVVDKPADVPVPPTLDNLHENVLRQVSVALGEPLWITHRLDLPTRGLVVLAKSRRAQSLFNKWLNSGRVEKRYRALTAEAVPQGTHVHWQKPDPAAPKIVSREAVEGWLRCELEVTSCRHTEGGWESEIRLVTGRTHQIRCQLADLERPLLGDMLYGGSERKEGLALQAFHLSFPDRRSRETLAFELPAPW